MVYFCIAILAKDPDFLACIEAVEIAILLRAGIHYLFCILKYSLSFQTFLLTERNNFLLKIFLTLASVALCESVQRKVSEFIKCKRFGRTPVKGCPTVGLFSSESYSKVLWRVINYKHPDLHSYCILHSMKKTSLLVTSLFIPLLTFALSSSTTTVVTTAPVTKTCTLPTTILFQKGMKDTSKKYITTLQTILYTNGYQTI